ncbi:Sulfate transport system permease protein CysW [Pluralibacter gergoviae]|nr:Sulfate transport system permease protein CysW [Pluralibacter gergoviae]
MFAVSTKRVLPGFSLSLGTSLLFVCLILLLPLSALVIQLSQMSWAQYWQVIANPQVVAAYKVTLLSAFVASIFNGVFGLLMAWILTRYRFPGRTLLDALMDLPFALPTAVAGLTLASLFSVNGFYGEWLAKFDIKVTYTWLGIAVAMAFTSIPFVVRTVQPVLEELGPEYEEAAETLGATRLQSFRKVVLPELYPALLAGIALSFTRSLGEFGAVIFIAGNIAWKTEVTSLMIFVNLQQFDYPAASAIASVILAASLLLLFSINTLQKPLRAAGGRSLMAEVTQLKRYDAPRINWGKWFLIGTGMLVSTFILLVPMIYIFVQAFSKGLMPVLNNLADPDMLHAIWLTVMIALITVPVNLVFGTLLAWLVTRFTFPGRQLLLTLLDIPFAVSPVVAGLVYLLFYGANGPIGPWLDAHNIQIMFAWPGMVLATIFVTCPFVVRELVPVMLSQGSNEDEAAILLGASGWQMFRRVTLPNIRWALLYGVVLTNARAIGEFGAVSVVSGSIRGETLSLPLQIELLEQDYNTVGSFTAAALLTLMAILTLFLKSMLQWRLENQEKRARQEKQHEH